MEHFRRGTRAYDLGHFIEAAAEYEKAYEAKENPALLYNLGQAYRGAGEHQKALNAYRAYLRNSPADAPNRDAVASFIDALKKTIELQKQTAEKPPAGAIPPPPPSAKTEPLQVVIVAPPPPPPTKREPDLRELGLGKKLRIAGAAVAAAGVGGLIAGGVLAGWTAKVNHTLNNPPSGATYDKSNEQKGRIDQALATTFFVVGGAALIGGVAALAWGSAAVKRNTFAVAPSFGPTHAAATFRMSF
jgi:tetratricopeptide (TPR) repeat protein